MLLPFIRTSCYVGFLNSVIFNSFRNRVEFGTILVGLQNFGGAEFEHPKPPLSVRHCLQFPLLCVNVCRHISTGLYRRWGITCCLRLYIRATSCFSLRWSGKFLWIVNIQGVSFSPRGARQLHRIESHPPEHPVTAAVILETYCTSLLNRTESRLNGLYQTSYSTPSAPQNSFIAEQVMRITALCGVHCFAARSW